MIDPFEDRQAARQLEQDAFLDALNEFDVSVLTDEQLRRLADIVDGLGVWGAMEPKTNVSTN